MVNRVKIISDPGTLQQQQQRAQERQIREAAKRMGQTPEQLRAQVKTQRKFESALARGEKPQFKLVTLQKEVSRGPGTEFQEKRQPIPSIQKFTRERQQIIQQRQLQPAAVQKIAKQIQKGPKVSRVVEAPPGIPTLQQIFSQRELTRRQTELAKAPKFEVARRGAIAAAFAPGGGRVIGESIARTFGIKTGKGFRETIAETEAQAAGIVATTRPFQKERLIAGFTSPAAQLSTAALGGVGVGRVLAAPAAAKGAPFALKIAPAIGRAAAKPVVRKGIALGTTAFIGAEAFDITKQFKIYTD